MEPATAAQKGKTPLDELKEMLDVVARSIVDQPDDIVVLCAPGEGFVHFEVRCDQGDAGTLIGRRGVHAEAIRTLMMAAGAKRDLRVTLQILGRDGDEYAPAR